MNQQKDQKLPESKVKLEVPGTGFLCFDGRPIIDTAVFSDGSLEVTGADIGESFSYYANSDEWSFRYGETRASDVDFEHCIETKLVGGSSDTGEDDRWSISERGLASSEWSDLLAANGMLQRKLPEGTHEYLFDVQLDASITINASSEEVARSALRAELQCASANLGEILGQTIVCEVSLNDEPVLAMIDCKDIPERTVPEAGPKMVPQASLLATQSALSDAMQHAQQVEKQRDKLLEALRIIGNQSIGSDWTAEQAVAFIKEHSREARAAVLTEIRAIEAESEDIEEAQHRSSSPSPM